MTISRRAILFGALAAMAALYSLAYCPGLEYHSGYYGFSYKIIHPESFPTDPFLSPGQPAFLAHLPAGIRSFVAMFYGGHPAYFSLYTPFVKMVGDLWLDDRFNLAVYGLLVFFCYWGLYRIAALCGLSCLERLGVLALLSLDHTFKDHVFQIMTSKNYSPTNFAYPAAIWLAYFILRGKAPVAIACFTVLCLLVSIKNTWFACLAALLFFLRETRRVSWKKIVLGALFSLAAFFTVYFFLHGENSRGAFLFDRAHASIENKEANPFLEAGAGNALYLLLLSATLFVTVGSRELTSRMRALSILSAWVFLGGGIYYSYAPHPLKVPFLMALAVNRSTWWMCLLLWVFWSAFALRTFDRGTPKARFAGLAILLFLYSAPWFAFETLQIWPKALIKAGLVLLFLAILAASRFLHQLSPKRFLLTALMAAMAVGLGSKVWERRVALQFLMAHGIMGDNPSAKWIGVDEYFRNETPASASFLAIVPRDYPWRPPGVYMDGSLKIRTGRATPSGHEIAVYFDYKKQKLLAVLERVVEELGERWGRQDGPGVAESLSRLGPPDYLVVPLAKAQWLKNVPGFPYHVEKIIREFAIMHRGARD